jgi:PPOX class probable F420-dependent enzyme
LVTKTAENVHEASECALPPIASGGYKHDAVVVALPGRYVVTMATREKIEEFLAQPHNVIVAGIRKDGLPHLSPNWFWWDGKYFYVSTTRSRAKYAIFQRDPRAQLAIDDPNNFRAVLVAATTKVREDITAELPVFRAIRENHGMALPSDEDDLRALKEEGRVLLVFTPEGPPETWTAWGFD